MKIGQKVVVVIQNREAYARGAADALNGMTGIIEQVSQRNGELLVTFDKPASTWWANQRPVKANWFDPADLKVLDEAAR